MPLLEKRGSETSTKPSVSADNNRLMLVEVFDQPEGSRFRFLRSEELTDISGGYRVLYRADVDAGSLFRVTPSPEVVDLPDVGTRAFLEGIETALNVIEPQNAEESLASDSDSSKAQALSSKAMDAATDAFFDLMEKNIDRWTYDASSTMLSSLAMQHSEKMIDLRREAADIQVKSNIFNAEFRAFFIESLVSFNCDEPAPSDSMPPVLELASSDNWKSHNLEPLLAREYDGQTKIEFSQLNQRLGHLLGRRINPDENILGPKAIAWTVSQSLNACDFNQRQRAALEPILIEDFNLALEKLYRHINMIWVGLNILPETKLEILKNDAA